MRQPVSFSSSFDACHAGVEHADEAMCWRSSLQQLVKVTAGPELMEGMLSSSSSFTLNVKSFNQYNVTDWQAHIFWKVTNSSIAQRSFLLAELMLLRKVVWDCREEYLFLTVVSVIIKRTWRWLTCCLSFWPRVTLSQWDYLKPKAYSQRLMMYMSKRLWGVCNIKRCEVHM